jgi:metallo-beta-lactamase family protein
VPRNEDARLDAVKLAFLGAATTVTGSQFLLTTARARVLVDCGMFQGSPRDSERNRLDFAHDPAALDAVLLTHAHLDHSGLIPVLVREGFAGPIHATPPTIELTRLILLDSGKVQASQAQDRRERAARLARRAAREAAEAGLDHEAAVRSGPPELEMKELEPLYDVEDAERAMGGFVGHRYGEVVEVTPGVTATFHDAGHILGSAIIVVEATDRDGDPPTRIVFSGDLGRPETPIIHDPTAIVDGADVVLIESTYGGREHEPEAEAVRLLAEIIEATADSSGVLLIPSFAIGRTQEVVWVMDRLLEAGRIPHVPLYLDSPMASRASDVYRQYPGYYDAETHRLLEAGASPLDYPDATITRTVDESKAIRFAPRPMMIVASNGMLTGGRVVHHLRNLVGDPKATILFVGYQGEGTLGAHLQAGAETIRIDGQLVRVRCQVRSISGFSAHADESELLDWVRHFSTAARRPRRVFIVHGDPEAAEALEPKIQAMGLPTHRPAFREEVEL